MFHAHLQSALRQVKEYEQLVAGHTARVAALAKSGNHVVLAAAQRRLFLVKEALETSQRSLHALHAQQSGDTNQPAQGNGNNEERRGNIAAV